MAVIKLALEIILLRWKRYIELLGISDGNTMAIVGFSLLCFFVSGRKYVIDRGATCYLEDFIIALCTYWLLRHLKRGDGDSDLTLEKFYRALLRICPFGAMKIYALNDIAIFVKRSFFLLIILVLVNFDLKTILVKVSSTFLYLLCLEIYEFSYSVAMAADVQKCEKRRLYFTNLICVSTVLVLVAKIIIAFPDNVYEKIVFLVLTVLVLVLAIFFNVRKCQEIYNKDLLKPYAFRHEEKEKGQLVFIKGKFIALYQFLAKYTKHKAFSFCVAKEINQILMEGVPLFSSILYGLFFLLLLLTPLADHLLTPISCCNPFMGASAYFALYNSLHFFARENNRWLLKNCGISYQSFIYGKLVANYVIAVGGEIFFWLVFKAIVFGKFGTLWGDGNIFLYGMLLVVPVAMLVGGLIGSYIPFTSFYQDGNIVYSSNEAGPAYMFLALNFIGEPFYRLLNGSKTIFIVGTIVGSFCIIIFFRILATRTKKQMILCSLEGNDKC